MKAYEDLARLRVEEAIGRGLEAQRHRHDEPAEGIDRCFARTEERFCRPISLPVGLSSRARRLQQGGPLLQLEVS